MANTLFLSARTLFGNPGTLGATSGTSIDWVDDNIKLVLVDISGATPYTFSGTHSMLSDIPAGARIATSANLTGKTVVNGVFDAAPPADFTGLPTHGNLVIVIYKDTGTASTSPLILYLDTGTNLPIPPGITTAPITFDTGSNKIFGL